MGQVESIHRREHRISPLSDDNSAVPISRDWDELLGRSMEARP